MNQGRKQIKIVYPDRSREKEKGKERKRVSE